LKIQKLNSSYLPKFYGDLQVSEDSKALLIEYISDCDLFTYVTTRIFPRLSLSKLTIFAAQLAYTIEILHSNCIVHRDIKLENIVISSDFTHIKLVDFDNSIQVEDIHQMKQLSGLCGSLMNLAPEVLYESNYSYKCDWYSFGIVLFRMHIGGVLIMPTKEHLLRVKNIKARNLIEKLLKPESKRLCSFEKIKKDPYFAEIDWDSIENFK
jgi:serine/threonine protein kinase